MRTSRDNPARQPSLREHNLALVLAQLADHGPSSRARLAAATGLTKATVSSLVDTLAAGGLVGELGPSTAPRVGRPGTRVALSSTGPVGIGLEINVDYLATVSVDLSGTVRSRERLPGDLRSLRSGTVLARAAMALRRAMERAGVDGLDVAGVAVAVAGLVQFGPDVLRLAPRLGWRDVRVLDELRARADGVLDAVPMSLGNEADLAALAELWCAGHAAPDGVPLDTFVYVSGEIGVGAGLIVDGALYRGRHGFSGEIGHLPGGDPAAFGRSRRTLTGGTAGEPETCSCGNVGCLEQYAGQEAILRAAGLPTIAGKRGRSIDPVLALERAAQAGDRRAVAALTEAGAALGRASAAVITMMDVDTIVLGGLYARLARWLVAPMQAELTRRVLSSAWCPVQVLVSPLDGEAAVLGAATSVVRHVIADPAGYLAARGRAL
jgi:predicted NBD/HSP70 family sugar kinase